MRKNRYLDAIMYLQRSAQENITNVTIVSILYERKKKQFSCDARKKCFWFCKLTNNLLHNDLLFRDINARNARNEIGVTVPFAVSCHIKPRRNPNKVNPIKLMHK